MAKRSGFNGGMGGNMGQLMKQAQKMQAALAQQQEELEAMSFEASAGGGAVTVCCTGKKEITSVKIDESLLDPDELEMLQDLVMAATNEALKKCEQETQAKMSSVTGGLSGGLGSGLF